MLVVIDDPEVVEADLAAGRIACPGCGGPLRRWGFASEREVRTLSGLSKLRRRRAICPRSGMTHVLEPASAVPRLRDAAEVIGAAWSAKVAGAGHRRIAADLGRSASTVRRWLRRLRDGADALRSVATIRLYQLDPLAGRIEPSGSALGDALEAVGQAARAEVLRFGPRAPWPAVVALTGGLIASGGFSTRRAGVKGAPQGVP